MAQTRSTNPEKVGLPYWMDRVLDVHSKVGGELAVEPVHDLRVALRRCILIAEIMRDLDPGSDWKSMRKVARRLFNRLGGSRDAHVLAEWIVKLGSPDDPSTAMLLESLKTENERDQSAAKDAVRSFDRKQWRVSVDEGIFQSLSPCGFRTRPACESLLIGMWNPVLDLHRRAQKTAAARVMRTIVCASGS